MNKFTNLYRLREVAPSDSKSCYICFKPTTSVLLQEDRQDFFYICSCHLKDSSFATPVQSEEYDSLIKQKTDLIVKSSDLQKQISSRGFSWTSIPGFGSKKSVEADKKDNGEGKPQDGSKNQSLQQLQLQLSDVKRQINDLEDKIGKFQFKTYNLDKSIHSNRMKVHYQLQIKQKKQKEMQQPGFFPSVPSGFPSTPSK